jgi:hypothetical protein
VFVEIIEKLCFLWCLFVRVLAASFVAVNSLCNFVMEILCASFDEIQESASKILARELV